MRTLPYIGRRLCIWIHGDSGTGKSKWVHHMFPECYTKDNTIYWGGYKGENCVYMEDFNYPYLADKIKTWSDRYK